MRMALSLALNGTGSVSPNPRVGCVIVRDSEIIGTGWHKCCGEPHAEVEAVRNAGRLVQEGYAEAVKLEGGTDVLSHVKAIVKAQIPVMGHIGLTPQSVNILGGFKVQGRQLETAKKLIDDAKRLEDAGAFSITLECVPAALSQKITEAVSIPTIGIGAGASCDGQVLVFHDMLGMFPDMRPKFVKVFSDAGASMQEGIRKYAEEVRDGAFPTAEHSFTIDPEIIEKL